MKKIYLFRVMRLLILFWVAGLMHVSATTFSQTVTLTGKSIPLSAAFDAIRQQTGYGVYGFQSMLQGSVPITVNASNVPLREFLNTILKNQPLKAAVVDKTIVLSPKPATRLVLTYVEITGRVVDSVGNALQGASIHVLNAEGQRTTLQTQTDRNGAFVLRNIPEYAKILISFIGYHSVTLPVQEDMGSIVLTATTSPLNEIVVQGYGTVKRRNMIGTISSVSSEEISRRPVSNVMSALQGLVPGLEITNAGGSPGASVQVRLRGINTMNDVHKNVAALVLVDGVPVADFSYLSPLDIQSVEVLKDASATAIYGSRGAAGVILITTKKGKLGSPGKLSFRAYTSLTQPTHTATMLNTTQYIMLRKEGFANDGIAITPNNAPDLYLNDHVNTSWSKALYKNAIAQDYQLNFTGGSDKINYYISGGYRNEDAIVKGDWYQRRVNTRAGLDAQLNDKLTVGGGASFGTTKNRQYNEVISSSIFYALPMIPVGSNGIANNSAYPSPILNSNRQLNAFTKGASSQFVGNFYFNHNIWDELYLRTDISYQQINGTSTFFSPSTSVLYSNAPMAGYPFGTYDYNNSGNFSVEPQLNYHFRRQKHDLTLLAGGTLINGTTASTSLRMTGFSNDILSTIGSATTLSSKTYMETPYKFASAFGRAAYRYNSQFLLEGTFRRDGSSRFGPRYKYGNFWSIGGGWVFSEASFIKKIIKNDFFGKLKVTYGTAGSDGIADFGYISYSNSGNYGDEPAVYVNNLANPYLQWEKTSKFDIGLELSLLQNKLNINVDYFSHRSDNTLFSQALPVMTGFSTISANLNGVVTNRGIELSLSGTPIQTGNFKWNTQLNMSTLTNKLRSLPGVGALPIGLRYQFREGKPLSIVWGFKYLGVDPETGLAMFEDKDESNTIASYTDDMQVLGKSIPDVYGGWNNTFSYKNLDLSIQLNFVNNILKPYRTYTSFIGDSYNLPLDALNRWQEKGDKTDVPRAAAPGTVAAINNARLTSSSYAFSDASYIRIKNVMLSYTLPNLSKRLPELRFFLTGYNLLTITGYKGDDPESGASYVPVTKTWSVGVNITL